MRHGPMFPAQPQQDLSIRPAFRVAGALLLLFIAAVGMGNGWDVFSREITEVPPCKESRPLGQLTCAVGAKALGALPVGMRGPFLALSSWAAAGGLLLVAALLLRPLFRKSSQAHPTARGLPDQE